MKISSKAMFCLTLLTGLTLGSSLLGNSAAWADRDDWGPRGYYGNGYQQPYYNNNNYGGGGFFSRIFGGGRYYPPQYGYANQWGGQGYRHRYDNDDRGYSGRGWNRGAWGNRHGHGW